MGIPAFKAEQTWLRLFIEHGQDICFELKAQDAMRRYGVTVSDVLYVLRTGTIVSSERDECGAIIAVIGRNCDEEEIEVQGRMVSEMMHVSIINVWKSLRIGK